MPCLHTLGELSSQQDWPRRCDHAPALEPSFVFVFLVELLIRIALERCLFLKDDWPCFATLLSGAQFFTVATRRGRVPLCRLCTHTTAHDTQTFALCYRTALRQPCCPRRLPEVAGSRRRRTVNATSVLQACAVRSSCVDQKLSAEAVIVVANASRRPPPPCRSQVNGVLMCSPHESRSVWVCGQRGAEWVGLIFWFASGSQNPGRGEFQRRRC